MNACHYIQDVTTQYVIKGIRVYQIKSC